MGKLDWAWKPLSNQTTKLISRFFQQLTVSMSIIKSCWWLDSNHGPLDWKWPLCQLSHNHCPNLAFLLLKFDDYLDKTNYPKLLWVRIPAQDRHIFTLFWCKMFIVCLKRPKINEKEAEDILFLKNNILLVQSSLNVKKQKAFSLPRIAF